MDKNNFARAILIIMILCTSFAGLNSNPAKAQEAPLTWTMSDCYIPFRLSVSFSYTNNYSVTDVFTAAHTKPQFTTDPESIQFTADEVDSYGFTIELNYPLPITQVITLVAIEDNVVKVQETKAVSGKKVVLRFNIVTREKEHPATKSEIADEVLNKLTALIDQQIEQMEQNNQRIETWSTYILIMAAVLAVLAVVIICFAYSVIRMG